MTRVFRVNGSGSMGLRLAAPAQHTCGHKTNTELLRGALPWASAEAQADGAEASQGDAEALQMVSNADGSKAFVRGGLDWSV